MPATRQLTDAEGTVMRPARSLRAEQARLSHAMRSDGISWRQIADEFVRRWGYTYLQAFRLAHGLTQEQAAVRFNSTWQPERPLTGKHISYWEAWPARSGKEPPLRKLDMLAAVYECSISDLLAGVGDYHKLDGIREGPRPLPDDGPRDFRIRSATSEDFSSWQAAMRGFRSADLLVGGGYLYPSVVSYLQAEVAPGLVGGDSASDEGPVFTAAAALTEMAGWMAHDAGRDRAARVHFGRSLALAQAGNDRQLDAHVLGSMSHLASHLSQPDEAIGLARQGQAVLREARDPDLEARLLAMEARGHAALQDTRACATALSRAEHVLARSPAEPPSPWVGRFDLGSLAGEAARCMRLLGDWSEARRQAEQIVRLRPGSRARSRAFGQLILVAALIAQGEPDGACAVAQDVIDATQLVASFPVMRQLAELRQLLQQYRGSAVVEAFMVSLDETLRERSWLPR